MRIQPLRPLLRILKIIAKMTKDNAEASHVCRARCKNAACSKSSGKKIGHFANGLIWRSQERPGNAETAVASWFAGPNKHLVKQGVQTPIAAFNLASIEVGEAIVVVPKTSLVIAEEASIARQAVWLIRNLRNCEHRSIHRKIQTVLTVIAKGRVAIVDATHDVGPRSWSYFDKSSPGVSGISGCTGGVNENAFWIAIEAILHEEIIVAGHQEVVPGSDPAKSEFDAIIK